MPIRCDVELKDKYKQTRIVGRYFAVIPRIGEYVYIPSVGSGVVEDVRHEPATYETDKPYIKVVLR